MLLNKRVEQRNIGKNNYVKNEKNIVIVMGHAQLVLLPQASLGEAPRLLM